MVSAAQISALRGATGPALLDAAAKAVGFPWLPSKVTEPIDVARPQLLEPVRADWAMAADRVDAGIKDLDRASMRVLDNWMGDSAKAFFDYVTELIDVVEAQHSALRSLAEPLERIQAAIEDAQRGVESARAAAVTAIMSAVAAAVAGDSAARASGPLGSAVSAGVVSSCVRSIVGTLTSYVTTCLAIGKELETTLGGPSEEMDATATQVSEERIREVMAPPPPRFSHHGFRSVNEPDDVA